MQSGELGFAESGELGQSPDSGTCQRPLRALGQIGREIGLFLSAAFGPHLMIP